MEIENEQPDSEWISFPNNRDTLLGVIAAERIHTCLRDLSGKVSTTKDETSLEQFAWMQGTLSSAAEINEICKAVALESYSDFPSRKSALVASIESQINELGLGINAALEDYADDIKEDFDSLLKEYSKIYNKLEALDANIDNTSQSSITVNYARVWDMFHVKNVFMGENMLQVIRDEANRIDRLVEIVGRGVTRLEADARAAKSGTGLDRASRDLPNHNKTFMMFNRNISVKEGQVDIDTVKPPRHAYKHSVYQKMIFFVADMILRGSGTLAKQFSSKSHNPAKADAKLSSIHKFIGTVVGMQTAVNDLSDYVSTLLDLFESVDESNKANLNRRAAPIMDLADFIVKQVTEISFGTDKIFSRLVRSGA